MTSRPLHILILVDRDWSHPQAGGTGANLRAHVKYFTQWGHRVTVMAGSYPGAVPFEREGPVTVHRKGGRKGVFPTPSPGCAPGAFPTPTSCWRSSTASPS